MTELQKSCTSVEAINGFTDSFNSFFVLIFVLPLKFRVKKILVDGDGKKSSCKRMFSLARIRDNSIFHKIFYEQLSVNPVM